MLIIVILLCTLLKHADLLRCREGYTTDSSLLPDSFTTSTCTTSLKDPTCVSASAVGSVFILSANVELFKCIERSSCLSATCSELKTIIDQQLAANDISYDVKLRNCKVKCCYGNLCNARKFASVINEQTSTTNRELLTTSLGSIVTNSTTMQIITTITTRQTDTTFVDTTPHVTQFHTTTGVATSNVGSFWDLTSVQTTTANSQTDATNLPYNDTWNTTLSNIATSPTEPTTTSLGSQVTTYSTPLIFLVIFVVQYYFLSNSK